MEVWRNEKKMENDVIIISKNKIIIFKLSV